VTASDEAFGLFLLKNYKDLPSFTKKPVWGQMEQQDSSTKIKKKKLLGRKLKQAVEDYNIWFRQFKFLQKKMNLMDSHISIDIDKNCKAKNSKKRNANIVMSTQTHWSWQKIHCLFDLCSFGDKANFIYIFKFISFVLNCVSYL